ncbi:LANO_0B00320g1_1 [Lachancea nothofagi CBS 11611]|uniref:LANO_0B00320g1_1 n=1 Tax=Lachancea nothofagi CBS 11611 TaxID=1266666 RepID=A0A1G4IU35_9SACH|nr:LANO_0B00320g1_1 [Lachancea nothofagi CBS 11611]
MSNPKVFRELCRAEVHTKPTSGVLPGYVQANLLILPKSAADSFQDLCARNPVACPLLTKTLGSPHILEEHAKFISGDSFDIRTDFPKYNIYQRGKLVEQKNNCRKEWSKNHIGFLIGCSFSFEDALKQAGLTPKNVLRGTNVSMFVTTKYLDSAGIFHQCPYVVSMRPYKPEDINRVREITRPFKKTHGEPIDWGFDGAERLGISDLQKPDYGDSLRIAEDEVPVFWACGVTPQLAIATVGHMIDGLVIGHTPGHMLVLDATNVC